ncbi:pyruvate, phosphate dikinase [Streptomyces sp. NPDC004111]|uniref:pyruvate, phosphate dikinase n=1 Tax=Streptomyces sp. NPDC004111 TaxID=3364690 RepID=UPI0036AA3F2D
MTTWIHPLSAELREPAEVIGGKAHGLVVLRRLGLPVPPGFVISTRACRAFLRDGRFPDGLGPQLAAAVSDLESATGRRLGGAERPLAVSVRSGAGTSMPGMMSTVLNLGLTAGATVALAGETGDPRFALDSRLRFLAGFASDVLGAGRTALAAVDRVLAGPDAGTRALAGAIEDTERIIVERGGGPVPEDAGRQLELAVAAVFSSWHTPRARTYRALHGIADDLGTAVTVQAMVYGNLDGRSGTGVAFSRDPNTGEHVPFGEVVFGRQGEDVVSGRCSAGPLSGPGGLAEREPAVWGRLLAALDRLEEHYRDGCHVEFTFERGELWILQVRPGGYTGRAAVRVAVDLVGAGVIGRDEAVLRVLPREVPHLRAPRIAVDGTVDVLTRGTGASPGVAVGRVATTADGAVRLAARGPVVLLRPETSPLDMHGLAAAAGVVTARGGSTSHAAVVARAMGKPAVVGAARLVVEDGVHVRVGPRTLPEGALVAVDGTGGEVVVGDPPLAPATADPRWERLLGWADEIAGGAAGGDDVPHLEDDVRRLEAARSVLLRRRS